MEKILRAVTSWPISLVMGLAAAKIRNETAARFLEICGKAGYDWELRITMGLEWLSCGGSSSVWQTRRNRPLNKTV